MDSEALARLFRSVAEFNEWKAGVEGEIDLEGADLAGRTVTGANLAGVNLKGARLTGTRFESVVFDEGVLYKAEAAQAQFLKCRLKNVYASEAVLTEARFWQCRLEGGSLARADLSGVRFDHSLLVQVKLDGARLDGTSMVGALVVDCPAEGTRGLDLALDGAMQRKLAKSNETHLDFYWIGDSGDEYAVGPLVFPEEGQPMAPYTQSLRRYRKKDPEVVKRFARVVAAIIKTHHRLQGCDVMVPVPPRAPDSAEYPNAVLTSEVHRLNGIKDGTNWLVRHKAVLPGRMFSQSESDLEKHLDSIAVTAAAIEGRTILLFDDYLDTAATVDACRQLLLNAGAKQVLVLVLGRKVA